LIIQVNCSIYLPLHYLRLKEGDTLVYSVGGKGMVPAACEPWGVPLSCDPLLFFPPWLLVWFHPCAFVIREEGINLFLEGVGIKQGRHYKTGGWI
jgi:hypothetical protein